MASSPDEHQTRDGDWDPPKEVVRHYLSKVLSSQAFVQSERLSRFLCLLVEKVLAGRTQDLTEFSLGLEVFGRDEQFDPRIDPIVRVHARRLRAKLKEYYDGDAQDELEIQLPVRTYIPRIRRRRRADGSRRAISVPGATSIAVLPFAGLSTEYEDQYFADGLTQEVIHALTGLDGVRVVGLTTLPCLDGHNSRTPQIPRELMLTVDGVLHGKIRRVEKQLRISVQLYSAPEGAVAWSEIFERELRNIFALQQEIARCICQCIGSRLAPPKAEQAQISG